MMQSQSRQFRKVRVATWQNSSSGVDEFAIEPQNILISLPPPLQHSTFRVWSPINVLAKNSKNGQPPRGARFRKVRKQVGIRKGLLFILDVSLPVLCVAWRHVEDVGHQC